MKTIEIILYNVLAKNLPKSRRFFIFKMLRAFFFRRIALQAGEDINIEKGASFNHWIKLGDRSGLGINCEMNSVGPNGVIEIGNDVMMGPGVTIYTRNHEYYRKDVTIREQGYGEPKPVSIGNDCWIGKNVIIMPGVKIGNGCVIGACAVVTRDIPEYSVVAGVPARVVKKRGEEYEI